MAVTPVSYTHLDVYKRQYEKCLNNNQGRENFEKYLFKTVIYIKMIIFLY